MVRACTESQAWSLCMVCLAPLDDMSCAPMGVFLRYNAQAHPCRMGAVPAVSSCSCADRFHSSTEHAESHIRSETNTLKRPYAKSGTSIWQQAGRALSSHSLLPKSWT